MAQQRSKKEAGGRLHNQYRPQKFKEVIGNTEIIKDLKAFLKMDPDARPHAYLFCGPPGCGKTSLTRILANKLAAGVSLREMNTASYRGIQFIRALIPQASYGPIFGKVHFWLFDEAHALTPESQDALLKLVEEPPERLYLAFCTTKPEKLSRALKDRCVVLKIKPPTREEALELVKRVCQGQRKELSEKDMLDILNLSKNVPRDILTLLERAFLRC